MSTAGSDPSHSGGAIPGPHAAPDDHEEIYFDGSPPLRSIAGIVLLYSVIGLAILTGAVLLIQRHVGPWWAILSMIVIALVLPGVPWLMLKRIRYRITNYRIDFERGLIAKNIDTMELWHVEDLHFHQSLMNRIFDIGTITVLARDESMPKLEIRGLPNPRPIYEMLKQRVIAVKRQRGVIKMDPG